MEQHLGRNSSAGAEERSALGGSRWLAAFLCFIIVLTTAGNSLLIVLILTQRSLRNTSNFFLVSLFAADLLVGLVVMPPAMLNQLYGRWVLEQPFCSIWHSFDVMCCSASILNLCAISLDRYLLILCPLQYKLRMGPCRALGLILAAWSLAALASFLPITMDWHELEFDVRPANNTLLRGQDQCRLLVSLPYALVASCLTFFLPSVGISFTYSRILLAARKQAMQVAALTANMATNGEEPTQIKPGAKTTIRGTLAYRAPGLHYSSCNSIPDFLAPLAINSNHYIFLEDLNFHLEDPNNANSAKLQENMSIISLSHLVTIRMHSTGHILDPIFSTIDTAKFPHTTEVTWTDHNIVHFTIKGLPEALKRSITLPAATGERC
ncbi:5-hydroxytryptamine receptor 6-like [Pleurodeles waltl]|uniref:5-hydroxytryptamine receptor 6-like n=1 Tax=Pleurodeles waltl TaxID=8319 RepID=UPI0037097E19